MPWILLSPDNHHINYISESVKHSKVNKPHCQQQACNMIPNSSEMCTSPKLQRGVTIKNNPSDCSWGFQLSQTLIKQNNWLIAQGVDITWGKKAIHTLMSCNSSSWPANLAFPALSKSIIWVCVMLFTSFATSPIALPNLFPRELQPHIPRPHSSNPTSRFNLQDY